MEVRRGVSEVMPSLSLGHLLHCFRKILCVCVSWGLWGSLLIIMELEFFSSTMIKLAKVKSLENTMLSNAMNSL